MWCNQNEKNRQINALSCWSLYLQSYSQLCSEQIIVALFSKLQFATFWWNYMPNWVDSLIGYHCKIMETARVLQLWQIYSERASRGAQFGTWGENYSTGKGWSVGWGSIFDPFLNEWSVNRLFCSSQFRSRRSCRFCGSFARKGCAYNQAIRSLSENQFLMENQLLARKSEPKICVLSCFFS